MSRVTLKLSRPINQIEVDIDENELQVNGFAKVIHCKDCKWYKTNHSWNGKEYRVCVIEPYEPARKADDFCSKAERKEE